MTVNVPMLLGQSMPSLEYRIAQPGDDTEQW
jgi:hypothetical protein